MNTNEKVVIASNNEETIINALKLLEYLQQPKVASANVNGIEGIHYEIVDGETVRLPATEESEALKTWVTDTVVRTTEVFKTASILSVLGMETEELQKRGLDTLEKLYEDAKIITVVGTNLPTSIYDGFPDIATHQLYFSTMAKIIIGEESIDAFDDYVERWYATGGTEVTANAQEAAAALGL